MQRLQTTQAGQMIEEIKRLKEQRNAVILAHNYQVGEIQDLADYTGDSLKLSRQAAETDADLIIFCGVNFMAETASILSPDKTVLIPDPEAGCSLADTINVRQLRAWKRKHSGAVVVSYVNTSAEVKAESDYCCTSANAVKIVNAIPAGREILFLPDVFLGSYVEQETGRKLQLWPGECHVHAGIRPDMVNAIREQHPEAEFLVHPECGCLTPSLYYMSNGDVSKKGTHVLSTEGMLKYAKESCSSCFLVATEVGILHRMMKDNPGKTFLPVNPDAVCEYMKGTTLDKIYRSLVDNVYEVKVPKAVATKARVAIDRMLQIS
ncbi:MAG: quinolinate synthase NadA [Thaumarchaeota archaeon]|nr:quinolinate synthase NadA [Nitrososphaerota archaeon]